MSTSSFDVKYKTRINEMLEAREKQYNNDKEKKCLTIIKIKLAVYKF